MGLGQWKPTLAVRSDESLADAARFLDGEEKRLFLDFIRSMLRWRPEDRKTTKQLLDDAWLSHDTT